MRFKCLLLIMCYSTYNKIAKYSSLTNMKEKSLKAVFGIVLKEMREERNLTQPQLSELSGVDTGYIGTLETGKKMPMLPMILRLSKGLGILPGELVNRIAQRFDEN